MSDIIKSIYGVSDARKAAELKLKILRNDELNKKYKAMFPLNATTRVMNLESAENFNFSVEEQKALMTKTAVKKFEELSKPL